MRAALRLPCYRRRHGALCPRTRHPFRFRGLQARFVQVALRFKAVLSVSSSVMSRREAMRPAILHCLFVKMGVLVFRQRLLLE